MTGGFLFSGCAVRPAKAGWIEVPERVGKKKDWTLCQGGAVKCERIVESVRGLDWLCSGGAEKRSGLVLGQIGKSRIGRCAVCVGR